MISFRILLAAFILPLAFSGCARPATPPPRKSPNGTLTLTTFINQNRSNPTRYLCVIVDITDSAGRPIHHEITPISDTQRWSIGWVSDSEVLLKNSDMGDYHIRRQPDGVWKGDFATTQ